MTAYDFPIYGVVVENLTRATRDHALHGETPNPAADLYLSDRFTITTGEDRATFPSSAPHLLEASVGYYARTAADVPAWEPGDVIRVRVCLPKVDFLADPPAVDPDWHTDTLLDDSGVWADVTLILSEPITARAVRGGGLLVTYTLMDPITALTGLPVTTIRGAEEARFRYQDLVADNVPATLFGYPVDTSAVDLHATNPAGPVILTGAALGDVLTDLLAGVNNDTTGAGGIPSPALAFNHTTETWVWVTRTSRRGSSDASTPYALTVVAGLATRVDKDIDAVNTPQEDAIPEVFLPATHVPLDGVSWQHTRGTNTLQLDTLSDAGDPTTYVHTFDTLVGRHGARARHVATMREHPSDDPLVDDAALARAYLGDTAAASPQWQADQVTVRTAAMTDSELIRSWQAFQIVLGGATAAAGSSGVQLGVVDVAAAWGVGPNGGDLHGTVIRWTLDIGGGELRILADLLPYVPAPGPQGVGTNPDSALTYQDVADTPSLAAITYAEVDPALTYYDFRLIGPPAA